MAEKCLLPDIFRMAVKMENGHELGGVSCMLQVINGVVHISLPVLIKVDQSRRTCADKHALALCFSVWFEALGTKE